MKRRPSVAGFEARLREGCTPSEVGVFVRSEAELNACSCSCKGRRRALSSSATGWRPRRRRRHKHDALRQGVWSSGQVVVMACDDDVIPQLDRIETVARRCRPRRGPHHRATSTLRRLHARSRDLLVSGIAPVSEFVDRLRERKLTAHVYWTAPAFSLGRGRDEQAACVLVAEPVQNTRSANAAWMASPRPPPILNALCNCLT